MWMIKGRRIVSIVFFPFELQWTISYGFEKWVYEWKINVWNLKSMLKWVIKVKKKTSAVKKKLAAAELAETSQHNAV